MEYRKLTTEEINNLKKQGCKAGDWSQIEVIEDFSVDNIQDVTFTGHSRLGNFRGTLRNESGREVVCGLFNTTIDNAVIDGMVSIRNVQYLSNYRVHKDVIIENVREIIMEGESTFGNGVEIEVLNEGGGRELPIFDRLSSQLAYLLVVNRHDARLIQRLKQLIEVYATNKRSETGEIEEGSRIRNTDMMLNTHIGTRVTVQGASLLKNGSVLGEKDTTTFIGNGVMATDFIIQSGSSVDTGAIIDKSFIGQGVRIGKQFSTENSVFFANSEGFHGEAVSIFGGPYTVTHHKSTLLIAGMFSFYNAGSGTNQSNHMYKLGPLHQGILERGAKTSSFSYLLWPCKVGAFSVVMGKHGSNFDTSDLPFSYLSVEDEKSYLTPAMNLITVGTRRDSSKWPNRDRRRGKRKLDLIHFDLFNPFIMEKILNGIDILNDLYANTPKEREAVNYNGVRIKRLMLKSCRKYYEMGLHIFIGDQVLKILGSADNFLTLDEIRNLFVKDTKRVYARWTDMSGLIVPYIELEEALHRIKDKETSSLGDIEQMFLEMYDNYEIFTWQYTLHLLEERFNVVGSGITKEDLLGIIEKWKENSIRLNNMIGMDAKKEFDANSMIGFGLGGDEGVKTADFEMVRGVFDENSFVSGLKSENEMIEKKASQISGAIEKLS